MENRVNIIFCLFRGKRVQLKSPLKREFHFISMTLFCVPCINPWADERENVAHRDMEGPLQLKQITGYDFYNHSSVLEWIFKDLIWYKCKYTDFFNKTFRK